MNRGAEWGTVIFLILNLIPVGCTSCNGYDENKEVVTRGETMKVQHFGRFCILVPGNLRLDALTQKFRECEVQDFKWQKQDQD
jgi:hypothetical protein